MDMNILPSWPEWETGSLIGRGSFGTVYEINRNIFGEVEKAALKVISIPQNPSDIEEMVSEGYDDESITSTFKSHLRNIVAEYSLMRKISDCKNIVRCDDVRYMQHDNDIGWDIFIKMELLTPLMKTLPAIIPEKTVIQVAKDMCKALVQCQKFDVIHRDIKPQNIFAAPTGEYKLGDFGIAKTVEKTMGGTKIGTYKYMAPEVYNNQPYGTAADQYSLGLVLYWMLNERRMPFLPLPPEKLNPEMERIARERRLSGEKLPYPANGSMALKKIVMKACAYDPLDRYNSAADMLEALEAISDDRSAVTPKAAPVMQQITQEPATVAPAYTPVPAPTPSAAPAPVPEKPAGKRKGWIALVAAGVLVAALAIGLGIRGGGQGTQPPVDDSIDPMVAAEQYASENKYFQAIQVLDEAWKQTQDPVYREAMAEYRLEFGIYNTSVATAGKYTTALLLSDGTVMVSGKNNRGEFAAADWSDIVAISAGDHHVVGLQDDGTLVTVGTLDNGLADVMDWRNVVAVYAGDYHTVAVMADGTAKAAGKNDSGQCDMESLMLYKGQEKIVAVSGGARHTLALLENGRVLSCGDNFQNACDVSGWTDIAAIYAGSHYSVGLKTDGTIVTTGMGMPDLDPDVWKDLVNLAAGDFHLVGLKADGTVVSALLDPEKHPGSGETELWNLHDVETIVAGHDQTVAVGADGTVWCVGSNEFGQCDFSGFVMY